MTCGHVCLLLLVGARQGLSVTTVAVVAVIPRTGSQSRTLPYLSLYLTLDALSPWIRVGVSIRIREIRMRGSLQHTHRAGTPQGPKGNKALPRT